MSLIQRLFSTGDDNAPVDQSALPQRDRRREVEAKLKELSQVKLSGVKSYGENTLGSSSFREWVAAAQNLRDPDKIRNALYYGFQPLYDCLADNALSDGNRPKAVGALDELTKLGITFLTGYYQGRPDVHAFQEGVSKLTPTIEALGKERYKTKFRNVDYNGIYPNDILRFMRQFMEKTLDGQMYFPDLIIGCACGSSEVVMPLAGMLETDLEFIRRSWRRGDDSPVVIAEQEARIRERARGRDVLCVEDYVCSGQSLRKVVQKAQDYGAARVKGASVNSRDGDPSSYFRCESSQKKLQIWSPR